jgi:S-methylmethionine-dependent homocysteine/selenocysteine methylase
MTRYERLMRRLRSGAQIVIDGGTGTEAERRGVPVLENAWSGGGALSHPDIVREIHEDYIGHGAEIIISNTFSTARHTLGDSEVEHQFEQYNRRGVELACEARRALQKPEVLVAGGISYWSFINKYPSLNILAHDIAEQAAIMADAGADLLMLEMMVDIDRMLVTLEAAQTSGLPVWVGFSCEPDTNGNMCLLNGEPLEDALASIGDKNVDVVTIMHTDIGYIDACLDITDEHWPGVVGVYAHSGKFVKPNWVFEGTISPEGYAAYCDRWLQRDVQIIGGCCGIRPDHIAMMSELV